MRPDEIVDQRLIDEFRERLREESGSLDRASQLILLEMAQDYLWVTLNLFDAARSTLRHTRRRMINSIRAAKGRLIR